MKYLIRMICVLFAVITLSGCSPADKTYPQPEHGILDLTNWDISKNHVLQLDGEWEFYWNKLGNTSELQGMKPDLLVQVPSTWNKYKINGKNLSGLGYATYRLHVKTALSQDTMLGLRLSNVSSAYKMSINDKVIAENGQIGKSPAEEIGEYRPQEVVFNAPAGGFDIIMQVSNFNYARGGFWYSIELGSQNKIHDLQDQFLGKEFFVLGALIILSLFYIAVFLMKRELRYFLYFSCLCMSLAVSMDMVGQFILLRFLPQLSLNTVIFIWYASTTCIILFLLLFMNELYKSKFSVICIKICLSYAGLLLLLYLLTPTTFYTKFGLLFNLCEVFAVICVVIIVIIGIKKGNRDGWLNLLCMLIMLVTYIHDVLYWTNAIKSRYGEIMYLGIFLCLFLQMIIQAKRMKEFYDSMTAVELSFLHAQIKPHFLFNAINTFVSISRYDLDRARKLMISFSVFLRRSFDIEGVNQFVPLKNELELVEAYVEIQKARFGEVLEVNIETEDKLEVKVPILVLQPIVENAIVHGVLPKNEGGRVEVFVQKEGKSVRFCVRDNGIGIEDVAKLCSKKSEYGSGVGLSNINKRLRKLYGKGLAISSTQGNGTEVTWLIPIK